MTLEQVNRKIWSLREYCRRHPNRNDVADKRREIYDLEAWKEDYYWDQKEETRLRKNEKELNRKSREKHINNRAIANEYTERYTSTDAILNQLEDTTDVEVAYSLSQMMKEPTYNGKRTPIRGIGEDKNDEQE